MEDKPENKQSENKEAEPTENKAESLNANSSQGVDNSNSSINATKDKIIGDVKKFNTISLAGLGMLIAFVLFMLIDAFNLRWWIMLPLAAGSGFLLYRQNAETKGFEKKVCYYGMIVLMVFVVGRDIGLTSRLQSLGGIEEVAIEAAKKIHEAKQVIQENS